MNKIPKVIHYCWFGRGEKPVLARKCIESWKKYLPEYELKEWNEDNFDVNINEYCREAYESKKYAFVSDVARLYIIYNYGGIYLDLDVEVIKSLNPLLDNSAFFGFEDGKNIATGLGFGAKKGNKIVKKMLDDYNDIKFKNNGSYDLTPCPIRNTKILIDLGLIQNNQMQIIDGATIYSSDYFCPKDWNTGELNLTNNSYTIHHYNGSWLSIDEQKLYQKRCNLIKKYGEIKGEKKYKMYYKLYALKIKLIKICKNPSILIKKIKKSNEKI